MLPESPRFLMSHDREEEAAAIFVKYHAEGDADSLLVKAEIAQVRETIKTEMEASQMSWMALIKAPGMRRRMYITLFLGLFTQLSGNTLLGYYSSILFDMMGYTTQYAKSRINVANACWSFINATILALVITRFPRRVMYMISAGSMLCVFIGITVSLQALQVAQAAKVKNAAAGIASLFFYFAYSPCYNMGNNALTYSKFLHFAKPKAPFSNTGNSLPGRALALQPPKPRHQHPTALRQDRRLLLHVRQPHRPRRHRVEVPGHLLRLDRLRVLRHLRAVPRDQQPHARGARVP